MTSELSKHPALDTALSQLTKLRPDQFELYLSRSSRTQIDAKDGKVDSLTRSEDVGLSVRLTHRSKLGFSFTTSLEKQAVERAVQSAFEIAEVMPEDPLLQLEPFDPSRFPKMDQVDAKGLAEPMTTKVNLALELEKLCRATDQRITGIRSATVSESFGQVCLVDSQGKRIAHEDTLFTASLYCKAEQDGDSQMGGDYEFSPTLSRLNISAVAKNSARYATELLGATTPPTLTCPAILRNNVVAELIEFLSSSFSAEQIDKGRSLLAGKENEPVFASHVTLVDDGLLPGGYGTAPFDAEGTPSQRTTLVDKGVFRSALYDVYYARKFKRKPTGSSSRGIKSPPRIGFTNLFIEPGPQSLDQLVSGISKGVLITDFMGIHTANPVTGDFSLGASGLFIEQGRITHPVKGFAVAGNLLELFKRITDIGNDRRFFGNVGAPSVRVAEVSVGGS
jgi:PmbA protein